MCVQNEVRGCLAWTREPASAKTVRGQRNTSEMPVAVTRPFDLIRMRAPSSVHAHECIAKKSPFLQLLSFRFNLCQTRCLRQSLQHESVECPTLEKSLYTYHWRARFLKDC